MVSCWRALAYPSCHWARGWAYPGQTASQSETTETITLTVTPIANLESPLRPHGPTVTRAYRLVSDPLLVLYEPIWCIFECVFANKLPSDCWRLQPVGKWFLEVARQKWCCTKKLFLIASIASKLFIVCMEHSDLCTRQLLVER